MKLELTDIANYWNQAIEDASGLPGRMSSHLLDIQSYEVRYDSEDDETIIKLNGVNIMFEVDDETVILGSKGGLTNFKFYY